MWVEQWPLTSEKLQAASQLINEQLSLGHLEPSTSPWNTPIFVIKKKSGKWRLLQDLRKVNTVMEPMGALQPGLPSPVAVPRGDNIIVVDLQDCFFTIPLHPNDRPKFAFSLPSTNLKRPFQRFQWKVLPQGMKNSPTLCQKFVDLALQEFRKKFPSIYVIHYMDDILISHKDRASLQTALAQLIEVLTNHGLIIAPGKIQVQPPYNFLGRQIHSNFVSPQTLQLRMDNLTTLNDFQKLLGDINWLRPYLRLTTADLQPLFNILRGDSNPRSPRLLTDEAKKALQLFESKLSQNRVLRIDYNLPWQLIILPTAHTPTGCLWQQGPLEWLHLPSMHKKVITPYCVLISTLITKGRYRSKELFGKDVDEIIIPYNSEQLTYLISEDETWQIALLTFVGKISHHLPKNPLLHFVKQHPVIFQKTCSSTPVPQPASLVFTDGSSNGMASLIIDSQKFSFKTEEKSAQRVELCAVIEAFKRLKDVAFNLYTDSSYIATLFPHIETTPLTGSHTAIIALLTQLQDLIYLRNLPFFVGHVRAHSNLPGPVHESNALADSLTKTLVGTVQAAKENHALHHQNATALRFQFRLPREAARAIVRECAVCPEVHPAPKMGVNPRGLRPNDLWQMDVTHIASFGRMAYVHVVVDTFSHVIWATARTGEAVKDVTQHLCACFAVLGCPKAIKTDNAPAYTSKAFQSFCSMFSISHSTGIPYNPQGQAIVERSNQILKTQISKLQQTEFKHSSPQYILNHALFVLNHLNLDQNGESSFSRHCSHIGSSPKPLVKWKDVLTGQWKGPDFLLTSGRGYACVFPQDSDSPIWIPDRLIRHHVQPSSTPGASAAIKIKASGPQETSATVTPANSATSNACETPA